ncbi:MAG: PKD domain-containing protein [Vicinamibacterales bacterium]
MSFVPRSAVLLAFVVVSAVAGCDKVPLLAPTNTTIRLVATVGVLPLAGSTDITAVVIESAGTPVQNGTVISFTSSLGTIEPHEARTSNGQVTVRFVAGGQSGKAAISAFSGGSKSDDLEILVGAAAAGAVTLRAGQTSLPTTGGTTTMIATVVDTGGNPLPNTPVAFSTSAGTLSQSTALTNSLGEARSDLTTNVAAKVTASVGGGATPVSATLDIVVTDLPVVDIAVVGGTGTNTAEIGLPTVFSLKQANATTSSAIRSLRIDFGDGTIQSLGPLSGTITVSHQYARTGFYTVAVTATDALGLVGVTTMILQVNDRFAIPLTVTSSNLGNGIVNFSATATPRTGTTIRVYEWDFGDGTVITTTGGLTTHRYSSVGTYRVTLRVIATNGDEGSAVLDVRAS